MNVRRLTLLAMLLPMVALATNTPPDPTSSATAGAGATASSSATGGPSSATTGASTATSGASTATAGPSSATGGAANGEVNQDQVVEGDQNAYRSTSRSYALVLPGLVAAPAVAGVCLTHTRGIGVFSIGVTGGTKIDKGCLTDMQCLAKADRYAAWGQIPAAMAQLEACGAVHGDYLPPPPPPAPPAPIVVQPPAPPPDLSRFATKDELADEVQRLEERGNRIFRQGLGK